MEPHAKQEQAKVLPEPPAEPSVRKQGAVPGLHADGFGPETEIRQAGV